MDGGGMSVFYLMALLAAFCIGLSKSGFSGISMVSVFLLADLYGAKASVGLALPLLIAADLMAYPAFLKHGSWRPVWRLLGPTLAGLAIGWWMLGWIPDAMARRVIGACCFGEVCQKYGTCRQSSGVCDKIVTVMPLLRRD